MTTRPHASKPLLAPFSLGDLTLRNRIAMAPLTRSRAGRNRIATPLMARYYAQRSGAGLIISEATSISTQGNGWIDAPGIYTPEQAKAWEGVVQAVHQEGGHIFLQLWHMGRASHSSFHDGALPVAPSPLAIAGKEVRTPQGPMPYETPRPLETDEIPGVIDSYILAAKRAQDAGFDGVELHAANGYLLDQFLQSKTNHRSDAYGGSVEARFLLLRQVVEGVTKALGPGKVGVRISPNGAFNDMGSPDFREQFSYAARELAGYDMAYLHVMDGLSFGFHELGPAMTLQEFRALFPHPIIGNCGYTFETAQDAISQGHADLIAFGRPFISNPDLVDRYAHSQKLAPWDDMSRWYCPGEEGYTNYPRWNESPQIK